MTLKVSGLVQVQPRASVGLSDDRLLILRAGMADSGTLSIAGLEN
jgi:hypothetical protein